MEFYEKLIRLRKSRRMTQSDLAAVLGVSRQAVYKWECGQSYPEAMKLVSLKQLFGISIDDLLDPDYAVEAPLRARKEKTRNAAQTVISAANPPAAGAENATIPSAAENAEDKAAVEKVSDTVMSDVVPAADVTASATPYATEAQEEDVAVFTETATAAETPAEAANDDMTAPVTEKTVTPAVAPAAEKAADSAREKTAHTAAPAAEDAKAEAPLSERKAPDMTETPAAAPVKEEKPKKRSFFARLFGRK